MVWFRFIVFNAIFNNISVIWWQSVLLVEETGLPRENLRSFENDWEGHLANWRGRFFLHTKPATVFLYIVVNIEKSHIISFNKLYIMYSKSLSSCTNYYWVSPIKIKLKTNISTGFTCDIFCVCLVLTQNLINPIFPIPTNHLASSVFVLYWPRT